MLFPVKVDIFLPILIWSFSLGMMLSLVYDIFRIRRALFLPLGSIEARDGSKIIRLITENVSKIDTVLIFFEDIIFLVFCAVILILIAFKLSFGIPRWYSGAALLLGFFVCRITAGRLIMKYFEAALRLLCRTVLAPIIKMISKMAKKVKSAADAAYTKKHENNTLLCIKRRDEKSRKDDMKWKRTKDGTSLSS